jgi:hypothetical protein
MKKMIMFLSILCLIHTACNSYKEPASVKAVKMIRGIAATGAYMPDGSIVQVRPAPIPTGNTILVGSYNGYESWVTEENPADVVSGAVVGNEGVYNIDLTNTTGPYIIRIQDPVSLKWYYSYANDSSEIANVNPYTDWMIRYYYYAFDFNVDDCFPTGLCAQTAENIPLTFMKSSFGFDSTFVYWLNMPLPFPDIAQITRAMSELQYVVDLRWSVDIGDVLTRNWAVGESYDSILDGSTLNISYITTMLNISYRADDMWNRGVAFYDTVNTVLRVEVWTPYPYCRVDWPDGTGNTDLTLMDTTNGVNHFMREAPYTIKPMQVGVKFNNVPFSTPLPGTAVSVMTFDK